MTIKLLIIEDLKKQQQYFTKSYKKEIEAGNYELIFTQTGEEALEIINNDKQREIDLIIADLKLPAAKIDGWQFIRTLSKISIDIKIIVITAWGHLDNFSEQERKNIVYFIERNSEEDKLKLIKERIELVLNLPARFTTESKKVRFNTLRKVTKDLTSKQKIQLIEETVSTLDLKELKQIKKQFPEWIERSMEEAFKRDRIRQWLLKKEEAGEFKLPISIKDIDFFSVGENKLSSGIYYRIQWTQDGKFTYKQIPATLSNEFSLLMSENPDINEKT